MFTHTNQQSNCVSRRNVLAGVSGITLLSIGGCTVDQAEQLAGRQGSEVNYGPTAPGFKRIGWTSDNTLEIEFTENHGMDEFAFRHESQSLRDSLAFRSAPDFAGTVELDTFSILADVANPPAGEYKFVALEGGFTYEGDVEVNELGSVSFYIEPMLEIESTTVSDNYLLEIEVKNSGNAPATVEFVEVEDNTVSASGSVGIDKTATIQTDEPPFPESEEDSNCVDLLEDFTADIRALPRIDGLSAEVSTEFESERRCTTSTL